VEYGTNKTALDEGLNNVNFNHESCRAIPAMFDNQGNKIQSPLLPDLTFGL